MIADFKNITNDLLDFKKKNDHLKIINRKKPTNSELFFEKLLTTFSSKAGFIRFDYAKENIKKLLHYDISKNIKNDPFYDIWINDMSEICKVFCKFLGEEKISFWIGTKRGCKRYHVDMVPYRLLVTYAGEGTEILPNYGANRNAYVRGMSNKEIIMDKLALQSINTWDIAIFRGGSEGILHRTPDSALIGGSSILLRLDNSLFLEEIKKFNEVS